MTDNPRALRARCRKILSGHRGLNARQWLDQLAASRFADAIPDEYGIGPLVQQLEQECAALLGTEAALFVPKGMIAQQIALRVWADQSGRPTIALHPKSHIACDEADAIERLHPLCLTRIGRDFSPFTRDHLIAAHQKFGAVTLELPLRRAGFKLPAWDELVAIAHWCRAEGIPLHIDGARLWESQPYYNRPLSEIAGLGNSIYVSFYKGLGGLGGCVLAGSTAFIDQCRPWQTRHGGALYTAFPMIISALLGLETYLPRMAAYHVRAKQLAAALGSISAVGVAPSPPQTNSFQLYLPGRAQALETAHRAMAETEGLWLFRGFAETAELDRTMVEISIGDAAEDWSDGDIVDAVTRLLAHASNP